MILKLTHLCVRCIRRFIEFEKRKLTRRIQGTDDHLDSAIFYSVNLSSTSRIQMYPRGTLNHWVDYNLDICTQFCPKTK